MRVPDSLRAANLALSRLNRRSLLRRAAAAGIAVPAAGALGGLAPHRVNARQADPSTLTIAMNGSPSDLDPHSVYDYRSAMPLRGPYEGLIALEGQHDRRLRAGPGRIVGAE